MTTRYALDRARRPGARFNSGGGPIHDAAEFKESEHPRAPNGQFGQGSGSGKSAAPASAPAPESSHVTKPAEAPAAQTAAPAPAPAPASAASSSESSEPKKGSGAGVKSNASSTYKAPTKTADEIVASFGATEVIADVRKRLAASKMSNALVKDGGYMQEDGTYTPERAKIHDEIIDKILSPEAIKKYTPAPGEKPTLTILGGRGGSGKGWFSKPGGIIDKNKTLVLDSDEIKEQLPGYEGWNAAVFHEESSHIADLVDKAASKLGLNVTLDGTLKSTKIMERAAKYQAEHDYDLIGRYMATNPETAASRALSRFAKDGKFNGRYVPTEIILGNTQNEVNFDTLSPQFKEWSVYENNGSEPRLVSEHKHGS